MKLLDFFRKNNGADAKAVQSVTENGTTVPESLFIDNSEPESVEANRSPEGSSGNIEMVFDFIMSDFESRGYSDALTNPDTGFRDENLKLLSEELRILVKKAEIHYEARLKEIDFHIETRRRAGLVDLVEELKTKKAIIQNQLDEVLKIKQEAENRTGVAERIALSYKRGFMKGLAAITKSELNNKNY